MALCCVAEEQQTRQDGPRYVGSPEPRCSPPLSPHGEDTGSPARRQGATHERARRKIQQLLTYTMSISNTYIQLLGIQNHPFLLNHFTAFSRQCTHGTETRTKTKHTDDKPQNNLPKLHLLVAARALDPDWLQLSRI